MRKWLIDLLDAFANALWTAALATAAALFGLLAPPELKAQLMAQGHWLVGLLFGASLAVSLTASLVSRRGWLFDLAVRLARRRQYKSSR